MTHQLRRVLYFMLQFAPLFVLFFVLYLIIVPSYEPIVLGSSNAITLRMNPATEIQHQGGGWVAFSYTPETGLERMRGWDSGTMHLIFLSLVTLPALLLATPAPFLRRLKLLAVALPLVFAGHVLTVVVVSRGILCLREAPGTFLCLWGLRLSYTSGQMVAAILWVLLTWRYWFTASSAGAPGTDAGARRGL